MAFGLISTSALLAFGVMPAAASASVHLAEFFTTAASCIAHMVHRNVDFRVMARLAAAGIVGGMVGVYVLTGIEGAIVRPFVVVYLAALGAIILYRTMRARQSGQFPERYLTPLGIIGGFADAIGGGGWGPIVTSTIIARGGEPRYVIGTVNAAEFLVTASVSGAFIWAFVSGHWQNSETVLTHASALAGLILGGVAAAPVASFVVKRVSARRLSTTVALLVLTLCAYQGWQLLT